MRVPPLPAWLAVACCGVALVQRPGRLVADTDLRLQLDPGRHLGDLLRGWTSTGGVGGADVGDAPLPMAAWFAGGDALGVPAWVAQRLWLALLLALAAWGVVALCDALWDRRRGVVHAVAAALYAASPFVVVSIHASGALIAHAALPWLLVCVHHGLRQPERWRWPATLALIAGASGGAGAPEAIGWLVAAAAVFAAHERLRGGVGPGALVPFAARALLAAAPACAWWLVPALSQDPAPPAGGVPVAVPHGAVVGAGVAVLAVALAGLARTWRWRYAPPAAALVLAGGAVAAAVGWPAAVRWRPDADFPEDHARALVLAGPLVALGAALLVAAALASLRGRVRAVGLAALVVLAGVAAWPLASGRAPERGLTFDVPQTWRTVAADLDREGDASRALLVPGKRLAFHRWGGTVQEALPALTRRPVASRAGAGDEDAGDLLRMVDELVARERLLPGQLVPVLELLGIGRMVFASDRDALRGGRVDTAAAWRRLRFQRGLVPGTPYGPRRRVPARPADLEGSLTLPQARLLSAGTRGIVRVVPRGPLTVVDGGAPAMAAMAAFGDLRGDRPLRHAGDVPAGELRSAARRGASVVIGDSVLPGSFAERALRGVPLQRTRLTYLFARARRQADRRFARRFAPPDARSWAVQAWVAADPRAADDAFDRLAGAPPGLRATSSSRYEGRPRHRASGAFDGGSRAWIARWSPRRPAWLAWRAPRTLTLSGLTLEPPRVRVRFPSRIRVRSGLQAVEATVGRQGDVALPRAIRGRSFRLEVLAARFPAGTPARARHRRAVGIGELRAPGLPRMRVPRSGRVDLPCGTAALRFVPGRTVALRARVDLRTLDAGRPLRASACGRALRLPAGPAALRAGPGPLSAELVELTGHAPGGEVVPGLGGEVLDPGRGGDGERRGVAVNVDGPAWLVLGEGFDERWRARCNGRDLGPPTPLMGYATAWRVGPACGDAEFAVAREALVLPARLLSLVAALLLVGLALRDARRPGWLAPRLPDAPADARGGPAARLGAVAGGLMAAAAAAAALDPGGAAADVAGALAGAALAVLAVAVAVLVWSRGSRSAGG